MSRAMTDTALNIRSVADSKWDCMSFGEVMLRFDPGVGRVRNARSFQGWEGGGEYNVSRAMKKCWGKRAAVVTAIPKNDLGWLLDVPLARTGKNFQKINLAGGRFVYNESGARYRRKTKL